MEAIFKPHDEEPFCPNNPRGFIGKIDSKGFRQGVRSGEAATREVIIQLLSYTVSYLHICWIHMAISTFR